MTTSTTFTSPLKRHFYLSKHLTATPFYKKLNKLIADALYGMNAEILIVEIGFANTNATKGGYCAQFNFEFTYKVDGIIDREYCQLSILAKSWNDYKALNSNNADSAQFDFINSHIGEFLTELQRSISDRLAQLGF